MVDELKRHDYDISPGTLYPLLHALEEIRALVSIPEVVDGKVRKYYRTTRTGDALLGNCGKKIGERVEEVLEHHSRREPSRPKAR